MTGGQKRLVRALAARLAAGHSAMPKRLAVEVSNLKANLEEQAARGEVDSQMTLGWMHDVGAGIRKNHRRAVDLYLLATKRGDAWAEYRVGTAYFFGLGRVRSERAGASWYRRAAEKGLAPARRYFGLCLLRGEGVRRSRLTGLRFLRSAFRGGVSEAALDIALEFDFGSPRNIGLAVAWYRRAANSGLVQAMVNLGVCCARGDGVHQDRRLAMYWYRRAAKQGNQTAAENLAELLGKEKTGASRKRSRRERRAQRDEAQ
jgi:TPR repeat protein